MSITVNATTRNTRGKGASRRLRKENKIPAIVYGSNQDAKNLTIDIFEMKYLLDYNEDIYSSILDLNIDDKQVEKVILKNMQYHPAQNVVTHIDFQRISEETAITTAVPIIFNGSTENMDIRLGAVINKFIDMVELKCLPKNLPSSIEVDITELKIGDSVRLSDLVVSEDVIITALNHNDDAHDQTVVSLSAPKIKQDESLDDLDSDVGVDSTSTESSDSSEEDSTTA